MYKETNLTKYDKYNLSVHIQHNPCQFYDTPLSLNLYLLSHLQCLIHQCLKLYLYLM